ncbi:MAG: MMPL family transporter [Ilumatobacteraceae bacterium]
MFARLGAFAYRRRGRVVLGWIIGLVLLGAIAGGIGSGFTSKFGLPNGVESKRGLDLLDQYFGGVGGGQSGSIVVYTPDGSVTDPNVQSQIDAYLAEVAKVPGVAAVVSPYADAGAQQIAAQGAEAGKVAYATVAFPNGATQNDLKKAADAIEDLAPAIGGVQIEFGGQAFAHVEAPSSELLGLGFAVIILTLAFGSVLATGLPIGTALAGIGAGTVALTLLSNVITMPDFATTLGVMMGLGVGIDYALFIVSRYRENLQHGHSLEESVSLAIDTSGRAVAFAGLTVVISLLGMLTMGVQFVSGLGIGAAVVVLMTMLASLTLLPALIGFAGRRTEVARWRGAIAAGLVALSLLGLGLKISPFLVGLPLAAIVLIASFVWAPLRKEVPRRPPKPRQQQLAYRWSRSVQHHPWRAVVLGVLLLGAMAVPLFGLRFGFSDQGNDPADTTTRKAYDLLAEGFGPGFNGPLVLVAELPAGTTADQLAAITNSVQQTPGVVFASPARTNEASTAAIWQVVPTTSPQDERTTDLVDHLRDEVLPAATQGTDVDVVVTGAVATQVDFSSYLSGRMPFFFAAVLGLSFLLLLAVFRSLLVPIKAVVMNLLSIGAAYGVVVAIFQWGWLRDLAGIEAAPIEPFIPMMLFAIVFGLSMDYEVFLLSRIKEEWDRTGDSKQSVADGLAATAKIITIAAAIMVVVFGSFLLEPTRVIRLMGVGLAVAVLLDATVVRMLLVPATMELLGDRNWWLPTWLDRILPRIDVEGPTEDFDEATATELPESREEVSLR